MAESSVQQKYSRYVQGGSTDVYKNRLGWWERETIPTADDDQEVMIASRYDQRPDLMANDLYGKSTLMWIILQFNGILDINTEFLKGQTIFVPSYQRAIFDIAAKPNNSNIIT
jgi:hypothetical protein